MKDWSLCVVAFGMLLNGSGCLALWKETGSLGLVLLGTIRQVDSIKCYTDNQGIPVAEEPYIIPEFKVLLVSLLL